MKDIGKILAAMPPELREATLNGPAHPLPPDVLAPNFGNPPNQNRMAFAVITAGLVITTFFVLMRCYTRFVLLKRFGFTDVLVLTGFCCFVGYEACVYKLMDFPGMLVHMWNVRLRDLEHFIRPIYIGSNFYGPAVCTCKVAILLEWVEIFVPKGRKNAFWWTCHTLLWLNVFFYGSSKIAQNSLCTPHAKTWDKTIAEGSCIDERPVTLAVSIVNFISDLIILLLPQPVIWRLQMDLSRKVGISVVFAIGILCCVAAAFRIVTSVTYTTSSDSTYNATIVAIFGHVEMVTLYLVATVPSLPKALGGLGVLKLFSTLKSWTLASSSRRKGSTDASHAWAYPHTPPQQKSSEQIDEHSLLPAAHLKEDAVNGSTGIMRTTHFTAEEAYEMNEGTHHKTDAPWAVSRV